MNYFHWIETGHGTVKRSPVGSLGALVVFISLIVACCAGFVKSVPRKFSQNSEMALIFYRSMRNEYA